MINFYVTRRDDFYNAFIVLLFGLGGCILICLFFNFYFYNEFNNYVESNSKDLVIEESVDYSDKLSKEFGHLTLNEISKIALDYCRVNADNNVCSADK